MGPFHALELPLLSELFNTLASHLLNIFFQLEQVVLEPLDSGLHVNIFKRLLLLVVLFSKFIHHGYSLLFGDFYSQQIFNLRHGREFLALDFQF